MRAVYALLHLKRKRMGTVEHASHIQTSLIILELLALRASV